MLLKCLPAGTRLGPFEIVVPLGAGGMGEVYRARDTKLDRDVALKILPESLNALIRHCLKKRPVDRPASAIVVGHQLQAIASGLSGATGRGARTARAKGRRSLGCS